MKAKSTSTKAKDLPVEIGAVHALKRLETEESRQYTRLKKAEGAGDPFEVKAARDSWLKTSEGLRRFDLLIEAARRETGELIPRKDVETWLSNLAGWLHFSLRDATGTADAAFQKMARALRGYCGDKSAKDGAHVPMWMIRALQSEGIWRDPEEALLSWRRTFRMDEAASLFPDNPKKFREHVETSLKADKAELEASL